MIFRMLATHFFYTQGLLVPITIFRQFPFQPLKLKAIRKIPFFQETPVTKMRKKVRNLDLKKKKKM